MKILKTVDGKRQSVEVRDERCKKLPCLVISDCNSPGKYTCRIRDVQGCPKEGVDS